MTGKKNQTRDNRLIQFVKVNCRQSIKKLGSCVKHNVPGHHTDWVTNTRRSLGNFLSVTQSAAISMDRFQSDLRLVAGRECTEQCQVDCVQ